MTSIISKKSISFIGQNVATRIDEELFTKYGFKVEQLMELAGLAAAQAIVEQYPKGKVAVLCGPGNNGGDGFVCARHLQQFGFDPRVIYPKTSRNELMKSLVQQCTMLNIPVSESLPDLRAEKFSLVVDALFGFSFQPPPREPFTSLIKSVVDSDVHVFSIDIPSGWHVEDGAPTDGVCIRPHGVISLTLPKLCMHGWNGPHFVGGRFVPPQLALDFDVKLPVYPSSRQIVKVDD